MKLTPPQYEILSLVNKPVAVRDLTAIVKKTAGKNPAFSQIKVEWSNHRATYNYIYRTLIELQDLQLVACDKSGSTHIWKRLDEVEVEAPSSPVGTKDPRVLLLEAQELIRQAVSQLGVLDKLREILK